NGRHFPGGRYGSIHAAASPAAHDQRRLALGQAVGVDAPLLRLGGQDAPEGQAGRRREARRPGAPRPHAGRHAAQQPRALCRGEGRDRRLLGHRGPRRRRGRRDRARLPASVEPHQLGGASAHRAHDSRRGARGGKGDRLSGQVHTLVASLARDSTHRLVAALARRLGAGRIAVAEDAVQHALMQALSLWPFKGVPARPEAWLAVVARNRALDLLRHEARGLALAEDLLPLASPSTESEGRFDRELNDDELALLFAVCHPALSPEMRVTLALKTVCGLTVPQIASGLLSDPSAIAQRLVRARRQLEAAGVAIEAPPPDALGERVETVRTALFLMFNEGYSASSGQALVQPEFCVEAVRLSRALAQHPVTRSPASDAHAALLALTAARLPTRVGPDGVAQLLEDQPREKWDRALIALGMEHLARSAHGQDLTAWHLRAEIAAVHATAPSTAETDWG